MSRDRFKLLLSCIRFDDKSNRDKQKRFVLKGVAVRITYAFRKSGIKKFLKKILNPPDYEIRTLSFKWLLFLLSSILTQVVCTTFIMSAAVEGYALLQGVIFMLPSAMNQFFVIYPIYYIVVLKILTKYEHRHLQRLTQSVQNDVGDINRLLDERAVVRSMKQEFEKLFNFIPFFTFGLLFISIPSTILSVFEDADDRKAYLIQKLVFFPSIHIAIFIALFCSVLSVSRAKDSVSEAISGLVRVIQRRNMGRLQKTDRIMSTTATADARLLAITAKSSAKPSITRLRSLGSILYP